MNPNKLVVYADVIEEDGKKKLQFNNIHYFRHHLQKFSGVVTVTVERKQAKRSLKQNALYWGIDLPCIGDHTGHTVEELHEIFKRLFLPRKIIRYKGKDITIPGSTTDLTKGGWVEYRMRYSAEAASMGIILPDPTEMQSAHYYEK
jgi:hypothetical protein